jgi:hypothetical protein
MAYFSKTSCSDYTNGRIHQVCVIDLLHPGDITSRKQRARVMGPKSSLNISTNKSRGH